MATCQPRFLFATQEYTKHRKSKLHFLLKSNETVDVIDHPLLPHGTQNWDLEAWLGIYWIFFSALFIHPRRVNGRAMISYPCSLRAC